MGSKRAMHKASSRHQPCPNLTACAVLAAPVSCLARPSKPVTVGLVTTAGGTGKGGWVSKEAGRAGGSKRINPGLLCHQG